MMLNTFKSILLTSALFLFSFGLSNCNAVPEAAWEKTNNELIKKHQLNKRTIAGLPASTVESNIEPAKVAGLDQLDSTVLHTGVSAKIFWGAGNMVSVLQLQPNAVIPEEVLTADRFLFLLEGTVEHIVNGTTLSMFSQQRESPDGTHSGTPRTDFVYSEKGATSTIKAGASGAKLIEVYSPLRADYLQKAGVKNAPTEIPDIKNVMQPNITANKLYDLYNLQLTTLTPDAHSRILSGRNMQLSFISMDPGSVFPHHIHPEEQMMFVLRGGCREILLDGEQEMKANNMVRIPGNMVHGAYVGELGCDALDIFWPAREDYLEKEKARLTAYHEIIPADAKPELLVDGKKTKPELFFTEGPKWMNGKIYFSNMFFDQNWNANPKKSSTVELDPNGTYRNITEGKMQTNGLYPYKNGNLIVCDMMGHRVVEMTPNGEVVKVLADKYDGKSIDGPNDVITDAKGGFYFTDPQFTIEPTKFQPGRAVYYVSAEGKITRVVEPNEFAMPNGILLSPDGKTLYINNCYDNESWYPVNSEKDNHIWAYDVNTNGSISNGKKFATLFLTGSVLDRKGKSSSADGMAIDTEGNLYVATYYGVQIFNAKGAFVGIINLPSFPVSLCFGDTDLKTLYIVSYSNVYKIRTTKKGFVQYL